MRDFFRDILQNLHLFTGLHQTQKMSDTQISRLLDELVKVSNRFGLFPEDHKKRVINDAIISDKDLKSITPAKINQWLSDAWNGLDAAQKFRYTQGNHKETNHKPLSPEEAQKYIDQWKKQLSGIDFSNLDPISSEVKILKKEIVRTQAKVNQREVACPGYTDGATGVKMECFGPTCMTCKGYGKIKVMA